MMTIKFLKKNPNGKSMLVKSYISLKQRLVGIVTATFMLLQVCIPGVAAAASLISNDSITKAMTDPSFQIATDNNYLYQQAAYINSQPVTSKDITSFHAEMRAAGLNLGAPAFIPVAGDITIFIPTYPVGKLVGDSYVQARYVRQQITDLLGRHMIDASTDQSEVAQINRLYANSKTFAINNKNIYKYGDNLPASQSIALDMIWPERRAINGQQVMVPIVYLSQATINKYAVNDHKIEFLGGTSEFKTVSLDHTKLVLGPDSVLKTKEDLKLNGSTISGLGKMELVVGGTLQNNFSSIDAAETLKIITNNYTAKTLLVPFTDRYGSGYRLGRIASVSAGGNLSITSYGDINLEASVIKSTNGSITLNANNNINIAPVYLTYNGASTQGHWQVTNATVDIVGSKLTAQETIKLVAGGTINITASELISTRGGIELLAQQGIYVVDELTQEQIQKIDRKGKTKGQSSEFRTEAVRSILRAGKGVVLDTEFGDVELKATEITSTSGAQVTAKNGKVNLLMTKELEQFHLQTVSKGTWTIKTRTEDVIHENNIQNAIVGGLRVQAMYGVNVEYTGEKGASIEDQIEDYRDMPGMEWMAQLYDSKAATNWAAVDEIHREIKKTKRNLSPAAMAVVAIAVAVATGGAASGLFASIQGSVAGAAVSAGASSAVAASLGTALASGFVALSTQAAQSLAAGNSLGDTINAMDSNESLKSLAISMATAGAMQHTDVGLFTTAAESKSLAVSLSGQAAQAVVNSTVTAGISVTLNGGNSSDYLNAFKTSLATSAVNTLGAKMAQKIGSLANGPTPKIGEAMRYIAHAGLGCALGVASSKVGGQDSDVGLACSSGAGGAVIGEFIAQEYTENKLNPKQKELLDLLKAEGFYDVDLSSMTLAEQAAYGQKFKNAQISPETLFRMQAIGVDFAKLGAGLAAFAAGGDVSIAVQTGENAAKNNMLFLIPVAIALIKMADLALQAKELYDIYAVFDTQGEVAGQAALRNYLKGRLEEKVIESLMPGVKSGKAILGVLTENGVVDKDDVAKIAKWIEDKKSLTTLSGNDFPEKKPIEVPAGSKGDWDKRINGGLEPNAVYKLDNGHTYVTDDSGRVMNVGGNLGGIKLDRNTYQQRCVGQAECSAGYDGGHLIASHLGGAGDKINLVPMTRDLNRKDYRAMEIKLGAALDAGSSVNIKIDVVYSGSATVTPSKFEVTAWIDGVKNEWDFDQ